MNKLLEPLLKSLRYEYVAFWAMTALLVVLYETDFFPQGTMVDEGTSAYLLQCFGVLLMIALIPLSLRLTGMTLMHRVRQLPLLQALVSYRRLCQVRLGLLLVVVLVNLTCYYLMLKTSCAMCAMMALLASLACIPSFARIQKELDLQEDHEEK
jgi:hypothetical protein